MKAVTNQQISTIHAILAKMGKVNDKEFKANLVKQYTSERGTSTKDLHYEEADAMITDLNGMQGGAKPQALINKKRRLLLYYAHQMSWYKEGRKLDMQRIDDWCEKSGYLHKKLNDYSLAELSKLIFQFEQVYIHHLNSI